MPPFPLLLSRSRPFISHPPSFLRSISTLPFPPPPSLHHPPPLPPNPASGSPFYNDNWRNPYANATTTPNSLAPLPDMGLMRLGPVGPAQSLAQSTDLPGLMDLFADWMTAQRWGEVKQMFEVWIRSLDKSGKPNNPRTWSNRLGG